MEFCHACLLWHNAVSEIFHKLCNFRCLCLPDKLLICGIIRRKAAVIIIRVISFGDTYIVTAQRIPGIYIPDTWNSNLKVFQRYVFGDDLKLFGKALFIFPHAKLENSLSFAFHGEFAALSMILDNAGAADILMIHSGDGNLLKFV